MENKFDFSAFLKVDLFCELAISMRKAFSEKIITKDQLMK
jgi:hypothetical protein